jgi:hypothetical protein
MRTFEETPERFPQAPARREERAPGRIAAGDDRRFEEPRPEIQGEGDVSGTLWVKLYGDDPGFAGTLKSGGEDVRPTFSALEGSPEPSQVESLKRTIEELQSRNEDLLRENKELQRRLGEQEAAEVYAESASVGITDEPRPTVRTPPKGVAAHVLDHQWVALDTYFAKTARDLRNAYDYKGIKIRVDVQDLADQMKGGTDAHRVAGYLNRLRFFWQALFNGVLKYQEEWCQQLRSCLDPATIEEKGRGKNLWEFYRDVFRRVAFYEHLRETQRFHVKDELRRRQESLVKKGFAPMLIE